MSIESSDQIPDKDPSAETSSVETWPLFWRYYRTLVDVLSVAGLAGVVGTTLYCLEVRAHYERSYAAAFLIALLGLVVMLLAWAQQAIAARDLASWRDMVEWQIRAAHRKIALRGGESEMHDQYFEILIDTLIADMHAGVEAAPEEDGQER